MKKKFNVTGMTCSACQAHVERVVSKLPGVQCASVNLLQNTLMAEYDEERLSTQDIVAAVRAAGYDAFVPGEETGVLSPQRAVINGGDVFASGSGSSSKKSRYFCVDSVFAYLARFIHQSSIFYQRV